jgi:hypothetical protein
MRFRGHRWTAGALLISFGFGACAPARFHAEDPPAPQVAASSDTLAPDPSRTRILVLNLDAEDTTVAQTQLLTEALREQIPRVGPYIVVTGQELEAVRKGQRGAQPTCDGGDCLGTSEHRILAPRTVSVHVQRINNRLWRVTGSLNDAATGDVIGAVTFEHAGAFDSLRDSGTRDLAETLLGGPTNARGSMRFGLQPETSPSASSSTSPSGLSKVPKWVWLILLVLARGHVDPQPYTP